jgi:hypothetical protein
MDFIKALWEVLSNPAFVKILFPGATPPRWYTLFLQPLLFILVVSAIIGFLWKNLNEPIKSLVEFLRRYRATPAERERIRLRRQFAEHVLRRLEGPDQHQFLGTPGRFTDLEADYYVGNRAGLNLWQRLFSPLSFGPKRIKAIARWLVRSSDRFALVEGDPGSGKTVLLMEVAHRVCETAANSWKPGLPVALYFNLKLLDRAAGRAIDSSLIREFIDDQLRRSGSPDISRFLNEHFSRGIQDGSWMFLFDSFDEIPDVLNSEDVSENIRLYSEAIFSFASDFNRCRTLLATRYFRRPEDSSQPKLRILPLSDKQRDEMVNRAALTPDAADRLYSGIAMAGPGVRQICENPMYLTLLIEYVREGAEVPKNAHELFGRFVDRSFNSRKEELKGWGTDPASVRAFTETAAFQIVAEPSLGLNPTRQGLLEAVGRIRSDGQQSDQFLDILEDLHFSRGDSESGNGLTRRFTFSHRRLQEYFATCYVIRAEEAVKDAELLLDARWRETAVVVLSSGVPERCASLLALVQQHLLGMVECIKANGQYQQGSPEALEVGIASPGFFSWPSGTLHLLSVLQDVFISNPPLLHIESRCEIANIIRSAFFHGRLQDRRVALEVAGALSDTELTPLLRTAISFGSTLLDDIAFRQMRALTRLPDDMAAWLRQELLLRMVRGDLVRDRRTLLAFLSRVPDNGRLLSAATLLSRVAIVDNLLHASLVIGTTAMMTVPLWVRGWWLCVTTLSLLVRPVFWYMGARMLTALKSRHFSQPGTRARWLKRLQPNVVSRQSQVWFVTTGFLVGYLLVLRWSFGFFSSVLAEDVKTTSTLILLYTAWLYFTGWTPMASAAGSAGEFTSTKWWPFLTLYPLLRLVTQPLVSVRGIARHIKKYWLTYFLFGGFFSAEFAFLNRLDRSERGSNASKVITTLMVSPVVVLFLSLAIWWILDWRRFRRFQNGMPEMAPADFLTALGRFRLVSFRIRFIRLVSGNLLLPPTDQCIEIIRSLALALERDIVCSADEPPSETGNLVVDQWRKAYTARTRRNIGLKGWGNPVLDEVARLEQRLEERRPHTGSQLESAVRSDTTKIAE